MKSGKFSTSMFLTISMFCSLVAAQQGASTQSSAPVPRLVTFIGKTTDFQGKPISGIAGVTFAIYKEQYEGAPLWLETQNVRLDAKGNYSVQLGASKSDGLPLDLFSSGEARWLGVRMNGGEEQPRVLVLSVPYALKAADAQTLGGLPASAFVLAVPAGSSAITTTSASQGATAQTLAVGTTPVTTAGGTANKLAKFDANADITNSQVFDNGTNVGISNTAPAAKLDVSGTGIFRGLLSLPATAAATATAGKNSQPLNLAASAFKSGTGAVNQNFRWQAEPAGNNTTTPSGTLNLLFGSGTATPAETGLKVASNGRITFAAGQTFPGAGTVKSVALTAPSTDFTVSGSPVTSSGTLGLTWKVAPTSSNNANAIVKRDGSGGIAVGLVSAITTSGDTPLSGANLATGPGFIVGVIGSSSGDQGVGVEGESFGSGNGASGVFGRNTGAAFGVFGENTSSGFGVVGKADGASGQGVLGISVGGDGVAGLSHSGGGSGVTATNTSSGDGLFATSSTGFAGFFLGTWTSTATLPKPAVPSRSITHSTPPTNTSITHL